MKLFRNYCFRCGKISKGLLCEECKSEIKPFSDTTKKRCEKCSKPLEDYEENQCDNCIKREFYFEKNISLFPYSNPQIKELVRMFKFEFIREAGKELSELLKKEVWHYINSNKYEVIICVPVSKESLKERGFNPVAFILDRIKVSYKNILGRKSHFKRQSELSSEERERYIIGQFSILEKDEVSNKSILVVDDIFTSGSTLNEISRVLLEAGAVKVNTLTFFRD
ncbi:MAG: phosphoribosyltransferase family protein [Brevinematia bacterium]